MKLTTTIEVKDINVNLLSKALKPEIISLQNKRSKTVMKKDSKKIIFKITAEDSTALRATLNSITKLLTTYTKAGGR